MTIPWNITTFTMTTTTTATTATTTTTTNRSSSFYSHEAFLEALLRYLEGLVIYTVSEEDDPIHIDKLGPNRASVTIWDPFSQMHVAIPLDYYEFKACNTFDSCPRICRSQEEYPYFWDLNDERCKSTHPLANPPIRPWGGVCDCVSTCHTPAANAIRSTWPWPNQRIRQDFYGTPRTTDEERQFITYQYQCIQQRWERRPTFHYHNDSNACSVVLDHPNVRKTTGSSKTGPFQLSCPTHAAGLHHLYFIPEAKLIFCGIPKVGITEWIKFFRFTWGAGDYLSLPHSKADRGEFFVSKLPLEKAQELFLDATWTKAVFFRDPAERLLSAYLDKVVKNGFTQKYFHIGSLEDTARPILTFEEFVHLVTYNNTTDINDKRGTHYRVDPHWRPQLFTCGLDSLLPMFNFVGNFNYLPQHSKLLLERVQMWKEYGMLYHDHGKGSVCWMRPRSNNGSEPLVGFNQRPPTRNRQALQHETGSKTKMEEYYTPELHAKVRAAYAVDYAVWDEIQHRDPMSVATGSELQHVRDICSGAVV